MGVKIAIGVCGALTVVGIGIAVYQNSKYSKQLDEDVERIKKENAERIEQLQKETAEYTKKVNDETDNVCRSAMELLTLIKGGNENLT